MKRYTFERRKTTVYVQAVLNPTLFNFDLNDDEMVERYRDLVSVGKYSRRTIGSDEVQIRTTYWARVKGVKPVKGQRRDKEAAQSQIVALLEASNYEVEVWLSDVDNYRQPRILFEFVDPAFAEIYQNSSAFEEY